MRRSSSARLAAAASLFMLLGAAPALAQSGGTSQMSGLKLSGDQPIQIESDKLEVRQADSAAIFSGNVTVNQGPTLLKAGKMTVYYVKDPNAPKGAAAGASAMTGAANIDHLVVENKVYIKSNDQIATGDKGT
ncbi:MAG: LPS ABC transporter substrate-binding protein LptA, partial [Mesorhizobium sp.]